MASKDVYLELLIIFVISFLILNFLRGIGNQLIFMLIAFIFSVVIGSIFVSGVKGLMDKPLITKGDSTQARKEQLHEKKYIFIMFFILIIGSTLLGTAVSQGLINGIIYPYLGSIPGEIIVSAIITLTLYLVMLAMFGEKLINQTSIGLVIILIALIVMFVFFSGYTGPVISYFTNSFRLVSPYLKSLT